MKFRLKIVFLIVSLLVASLLTVWHWSSSQVSTVFVFAQITDSHCGRGTENTNLSVLWIREQEEISFVIHTGDLTHNHNVQEEWDEIYQIMHQLDDSQQWTVLAGNHDDTMFFRDTFGDVYNHTVTIDDYAFVTMSGLYITEDQFDWLDEELRIRRDYKVIIGLHWLYGWSSPNLEPLIYQHLIYHSNVILGISGHYHENDYLRKEGFSFVVSKAVKDGYVRLFYCFGNGSIHVRTRDVLNEIYLSELNDDFWIHH